MSILSNRYLFLKKLYWDKNLKYSCQTLTSARRLDRSFSINAHTTFTKYSYCSYLNKISVYNLSPFICFRCSHTFLQLRRNINQEHFNKHEKDESIENTKNSTKMIKYGFILFGISFGVAFSTLIYEISKPNYDAEGKLVQDEFSHLPYISQLYYRLKKEFTYYQKLVQEPSRDKLLPDPVQHPYIQPPYTVILELTDVLVHPDWTYQTGWRFKKRPGVDQFLEAIGPPYFETVVYTAEQGLTVYPILDALDPHGNIMYRLFRDATRFVDGHHVKDLDALNRDLKKVIVVDWNEESVKFHPENMLKIPRWNGNDNDTTLYDLTVFLKTIYGSQIEDVREVISYYKQFDDPLETFKKNKKKLLEQLEEEENKLQNEEKKKLMSKWKPSFLRTH